MNLALLAIACRPDPGTPNYPDPPPWGPGGDDFYDDPLAAGEERLAYGGFYEGKSTEAMILDNVTNHFYIYSDTFRVKSTDDRWEGSLADVFVNNGVGWWGGGIHWDTPKDISDWDSLHLAVRTETLADWAIGMTGGGAEARVKVADYGLVADGDWHVLSVPLVDIDAAGADLTSVTIGLLMIGESGAAGDEVAIDGLYLTRGLP